MERPYCISLHNKKQLQWTNFRDIFATQIKRRMSHKVVGGMLRRVARRQSRARVLHYGAWQPRERPRKYEHTTRLTHMSIIGSGLSFVTNRVLGHVDVLP